MRFKVIFVVMFGLFSNCADAQFIRFTITVPPSFELKDLQDKPQILEPPISSSDFSSNLKKEYRWIELRTTENIEILMQASNTNRRQGVVKTLYLNDGSTNFDNAFELMPGFNALRIFNRQRIIKEIAGSPSYLSAWIGLDRGFSGTLTIVYL